MSGSEQSMTEDEQRARPIDVFVGYRSILTSLDHLDEYCDRLRSDILTQMQMGVYKDDINGYDGYSDKQKASQIAMLAKELSEQVRELPDPEEMRP